MRHPQFALALLVSIGLATRADARQTSPDVTYGFIDELRHLSRIDLLPAYRTESSVAQVSSYDTTGGNNDGFGGLYSFVRKEGRNLVIAELEGPGVVERIWTPTPTEDTLAFFFDDEEVPRLRIRFMDLFSGEVDPFLAPVAGHEVGGYYSYLPIPFRRSLKIVFEGERIMFHQIQYRTFRDGRAVTSFRPDLTEEEREAFERVRTLWTASGFRPSLGALAPSLEVVESARRIVLRPDRPTEIFRQDEGGRIVGLELEVVEGAKADLATALLSARWDGEAVPAIRSPVGDFFGYAVGGPSMRGLLIGVRDDVHYCYLPMPFDRRAVLELTGGPEQSGEVRVEARILYSPKQRNADQEGRFYARWRREVDPEAGAPYLLLDAEGPGHHVGTMLRAQGLNSGMTIFFEGDDVTYIDGDMRLHGTGSEDYFNGGWYALLDRWDRGVSLPLHGAIDYSIPMARTGGYRFYLADKVSFDDSYHLTIEHGPEGNQIPVDYTSVTYYYADRAPESVMDPLEFPAVDRASTTHEYYPQLMEVAVGWGSTLSFANSRDLALSARQEGLLRIRLSDVPPGRYRLSLSYERHPNGPEFSVWQRQARVSDWISSHADSAAPEERRTMGEVLVSDQIDTVTIRTRPTAEAQSFRFNRLFLEAVDE